jgi:hypothetical protein
MIRFPVACPSCRREWLLDYRLAALADAILNSRSIRLTTPCHGAIWNAGDSEVEQIRETLEAAWLDRQQLALALHEYRH